jgi:hypothetical protein
MPRAKKARATVTEHAMGEQASADDAPRAKKARATVTEHAMGEQASADEDARLIASLSRPKLESLLKSHLAQGTIRRSEVEALVLPPKKEVIVDRGTQREHTGFFDQLEDSLLVSMISSLSLAERLTAATCICKSWRFLRDRPELWRRIEMQGFHSSSHALPISGHQLARFVDFVGATNITALSLNTGEGTRIASGEVACMLRALPALRELELGGKAIKSSVLQTLIKHPATPYLTSIELHHSIYGSAKDIVSLLARAPSLEHIKVSKHVDDACLSALWRTWTEQRGGAPLLSSLHLYERYRQPDALFLPLMPRIASWFPELVSLSLGLNGYGRAQALWESMEAIPFFPVGVTFARLRELHLEDGTTYERIVTTEQLGSLLDAVLPATPALETLRVFMHMPYARKSDSHPGLGRALRHLPATIRELELSDLHVLADELDSCVELPHLRRLALHNCRGAATELASRARHAATPNCNPHRLETLITQWRHGSKPREAAEETIIAHEGLEGGSATSAAAAGATAAEL